MQSANAIKGTVSTVLQRLLQTRKNSRMENSYTLSEIAVHCHFSDCWIVIGDYVYDVTSFLDKHPGGYDVMMEHAGRDATIAFYGAGHPPCTIDLLEPFCIGTLAMQERVNLIGTVSSPQMWSTDHVKVAVAD